MNDLLFARTPRDLSAETRKAILESFSGQQPLAIQYEVDDFDGFFKYLAEELKDWSGLAHQIGIQTYDDLRQLVACLREQSALPPDSSFESFFPPLGDDSAFAKVPETAKCSLSLKERCKYCSKEQKETAIQLAIQLWLMVNVGPPHPTLRLESKWVPWPASGGLAKVIASTFKPDEQVQVVKRFPKSITVCSLEHIAGFRIIWTKNLFDHLRVTEDSSKPTVKLFLFPKLLQLYAESESNHEFLPRELLEETLETYALLLPCYSVECRKWFDKAQKKASIKLDKKAREQILGARGRNLTKYTHWGERLSLIKEAYDESEPRGLSQFWHDRRSGARWYAFWGSVVLVVLVTVIFGTVSSVTGILQVWSAFHPKN